MTERLQPALALLDEGLSLYRRHFLRFLLICACWFVPLAVLSGLLVAATPWLTETQTILLALGGLLLMFPLIIYLIGALSRAATAVIDGQPINLRSALSLHPLRVIGMSFFTIIYGILAYFASAAVSILCICPIYIVGVFAFAGLSNIGSGSDTISIALGVIFFILMLVVYFISLMISGASYSSLIYGLQPWVQTRQPFGMALQHSLELIGYRFWNNLLVWCLTALVVSGAGVVVTFAVVLVGPMPLLLALGDTSTLAQAVSVGAWMLSFMLILPPLPIWMALLYRRNATRRAGAELDTQIQVWWQKHFGSVVYEA